MNIVGKMLVIANLIFALATGGFLVFDFATRSNWKAAYDQLKNEMDVAGLNEKTGSTRLGKAVQDKKTLRVQLDAAASSQIDLDTKYKAKITILESQQRELADKVKEQSINLAKTLEELGRRDEEVKHLASTIATRDATINSLTADVHTYRTAAVAKENEAKTMYERNVGLLNRNTELEKLLAGFRSGGSGDKLQNVSVKGLNPPPVKVEGRITKVDKRNGDTLVEISIGSDQGIEKGQTLDVYRLPALYLGVLRITDATHHVAVARLERAAAGPNTALREGDIVASEISIK